jgi:hypothetical protein
VFHQLIFNFLGSNTGITIGGRIAEIIMPLNVEHLKSHFIFLTIKFLIGSQFHVNSLYNSMQCKEHKEIEYTRKHYFSKGKKRCKNGENPIAETAQYYHLCSVASLNNIDYESKFCTFHIKIGSIKKIILSVEQHFKVNQNILTIY